MPGGEAETSGRHADEPDSADDADSDGPDVADSGDENSAELIDSEPALTPTPTVEPVVRDTQWTPAMPAQRTAPPAAYPPDTKVTGPIGAMKAAGWSRRTIGWVIAAAVAVVAIVIAAAVVSARPNEKERAAIAAAVRWCWLKDESLRAKPDIRYQNYTEYKVWQNNSYVAKVRVYDDPVEAFVDSCY